MANSDEYELALEFEKEEVDTCKRDGGCIPNRSGYCYVCGMEVVTEVDDDGNPKLD